MRRGTTGGPGRRGRGGGASAHGAVPVRDSTQPAGPVLDLPAPASATFVACVRDGGSGARRGGVRAAAKPGRTALTPRGPRRRSSPPTRRRRHTRRSSGRPSPSTSR
ncbi:DUF397 domain-containing protein [Streptomyces sp. NPDC057242]|uniref:DUF397 domain-containing protein n=1 Tax=Streptomyces sp. NPDC057242 TaxID=3346063 RepID=UPI0036439BA3